MQYRFNMIMYGAGDGFVGVSATSGVGSTSSMGFPISILALNAPF